MAYEHNQDPFWEKQPLIEFLEELHGPIHKEVPVYWNKREATAQEVLVGRAKIQADFPDREGVLETAYEDFAAFLSLTEKGLSETAGEYVFRTVLAVQMREESYRILAGEKECVIESADTEGIRRALYHIEDEMHRREGRFLPGEEIYRYAVIRDRISRGFLNPHYKPGCDGELEDDTEYYSDNYLNRLAHDGVNSLWVQERFRKILPSKIIPEYGRNGQDRVERLNRLIGKCKRYGIRVYLEGIEPASSFQNPDLKKHPEVLGQPFLQENAFCSSTEMGRAYIRESCAKLMETFPGLAGMVNISVGEAIGCCAAVAEELECPHCKALGLNKPKVLADCEKQILDAMRSVDPGARLISWSYALRDWKEEEREEYYAIRDPGVDCMFNFEDGGKPVQLGKERLANDYWLSYTGPGEIFRKAAEAGKERNASVYAKIQVCSSHEVSTVPYVPVPGILYDKYRYMHENHVTGAMYCWYFGNYPCMMNKAAGELAFGPFPENKRDFLENLAGIYWGARREAAADAYEYFEEGYSNYPVSMTFEWHGPMGDGPVWPLHLIPADIPVSKAYVALFAVGGDRIGETMLLGHTHRETVTLCEKMSSSWKKGTELLSRLETFGEYRKEEQQSDAQALDILFDSGTNILKFYELRDQLGYRTAGGSKLLEQMRSIVEKELENSRNLERLCEKDKRLGYHSEAVAFKFFPEKLRWRAGLLEELLKTEFPEVEKRIRDGKVPLPFYFGLAQGSHRYVTAAEDIEDACWESFMMSDGTPDETVQIRISEGVDVYCIQIRTQGERTVEIKPEFHLFHPYVPVTISPGKTPKFTEIHSFGLFEERIEEEMRKWNVTEEVCGEEHVFTVLLNKEAFFDGQNKPFRLAVSAKGETISEWERGRLYYQRLIFGVFSPASYVFVIPREYENTKSE